MSGGPVGGSLNHPGSPSIGVFIVVVVVVRVLSGFSGLEGFAGLDGAFSSLIPFVLLL
jgi:hypothetical protein